MLLFVRLFVLACFFLGLLFPPDFSFAHASFPVVLDQAFVNLTVAREDGSCILSGVMLVLIWKFIVLLFITRGVNVEIRRLPNQHVAYLVDNESLLTIH